MANENLPTKIVKCAGCSADLVVQKWAARTQVCEECQKRASEEGEASPDAPATPMAPVDKLRKAQDVLAALGYQISQRGHSKVYQNGDSIIRIEPQFDKGTSLNADFTLEGILVTQQVFVSIHDTGLDEKIPQVCQADIHTLLHELNIHNVNLRHEQVHIDAVKCSKCNDMTPEWVQMGKQILCLAKCAPVRRPYGRT
jgi:hypothetical protein